MPAIRTTKSDKPAGGKAKAAAKATGSVKTTDEPAKAGKGAGEPIHCVFLRGVMPTGKNRVPMADLRKCLEAEGFGDVRTYIQSGNAVVRSRKSAREVEALVRKAIMEHIGPELEVVVRSPKELQEILDRNPFPADARDRVYFTLFATPPDPKLLDAYLKTDFGADRFEHVGNCLYTLYGTKWSDSKFNNNVYEKKLKVVATTRNTNTIEAMIGLGEGG